MFMARLGHVWKIFLGYASLVMLAAIAVTFSRGGWLVTLIGLVALCGVLFTQRDYRIQAGVLLALMILAGGLVYPKVPALQQRFQTIFSGTNAEDTRGSIWRAALGMWEDRPLWGWGPGQFDYHFPEYRPLDVQARPQWVHNDYLNTLVDYGAVGLALMFAAFVLLVWGVASSWRFARGSRDDFSRKKSNKMAFLVGAALGVTSILIHSTVDFNLHIPANAILAVTLTALLTSQWRFATERFWFTLTLPRRGLTTAVLLAGVAYLGCQEWRGGREIVWLRRAERKPLVIENMIATPDAARLGMLTNAYAAEPLNPETPKQIGDCYRYASRVGGKNYEAMAREAMAWYKRGIKVNPNDCEYWLYYGWCLDWIKPEVGPFEDSTPYFERASAVDPNWAFVAAQTGRHYFETGDLAAARTWLERSHRLQWKKNELVEQLLPLVEKRLEDDAGTETPQFSPIASPAK
jgi:hypothetical protein